MIEDEQLLYVDAYLTFRIFHCMWALLLSCFSERYSPGTILQYSRTNLSAKCILAKRNIETLKY